MNKPLYVLILFAVACSKTTEPEPEKDPTPATLIFPFENSECNEGANVTDTESTVLFEWKAGENTDEYELVLTNINTGEETSHVTADTEISLILSRGTPYAWYIISISHELAETARSDTWKFFTSEEGMESFAPFPAEIVSPAYAEIIDSTSGVSLVWIGSDVDRDIVGYDVFFGTTSAPEMIESNLLESMLTNVLVSSNKVYYWKVVTRDERSNSSDSGVYQFKVD